MAGLVNRKFGRRNKMREYIEKNKLIVAGALVITVLFLSIFIGYFTLGRTDEDKLKSAKTYSCKSEYMNITLNLNNDNTVKVKGSMPGVFESDMSGTFKVDEKNKILTIKMSDESVWKCKYDLTKDKYEITTKDGFILTSDR